MNPEAMNIMIPIGLFILGGVFTILWWLLRKKDEAQEKQISVLFAKHDEDAKRLQDLELDIAKRHYVKDELDKKFDKLEDTFKQGFVSLGAKFDQLSKALVELKTADK